jgi:hypothetical protein
LYYIDSVIKLDNLLATLIYTYAAVTVCLTLEGKINDTALSEDNTNELWLDIKESVSAEIINSIKNKIKSVFNLHLQKKELVVWN